MLFLELALIRWTGAEIFDLSHFTNFVLLGSFLGIGIGFLRSDATRDLSRWAPVAVCALVLFVIAFPAQIDAGADQLIFIGGTSSGLPMWISLPVIFVAVAAAMATVAEGVARVFVTFDPLEAYSLDIGGSILGIVVFSLLSLVGAPPLAWGGVAMAMLLGLSGRRPRPLHLAAALAVVTVLGVESTRPDLSWSPYYQLRTRAYEVSGFPVVQVWANGIPHQAIIPVSVPPDVSPSGDLYGRVYRRLNRAPEKVLIIGAGTGHDTAEALSNGVRSVDAVEIDPRLYEIGRAQNPDHPYDDPRVHPFIDDGRAFLERRADTYDLVVFALPDSLTLVSGQSSLRLESYLFTVEAARAAREHLRPGGVFVEYNYYREQWLVDRLALTLQQGFGTTPCVESIGTSGHLALISASTDPSALTCPSPWNPAGATVPAPAVDDHPFPYLREPVIPTFYLATLSMVLLASLLLVRLTAGPMRPMLAYGDLFFMGAAFLLLETKNVVQFALLFGTTWLVNALVFTGILVSVFVAVQVARRVRLPRPEVLYGGLLAALVLAWAVPQESLLSLDLLPRFLAAVGLGFSPVFFANLVFAQRFRDVASSPVAFAANLLGAMVGGVMEYAALMTGYRALLLVVGGLYAVAFVLESRSRKAASTRLTASM
ncbi:MAG: hypothetical protein QOE92_1758 [Chloroflexota bacterium]|nr:hypothetical protein [Chloroflexota bacterium]